MSAVDTVLFVALPYVSVAILVVGLVGRIRRRGFTVSSLSSQFLESPNLFWGVVPFHVGILAVLLGHLLAFLVPSGVLAWNGSPVRLLVLEGAGLVFGISSLVGIVILLSRRLSLDRILRVTTPMDVVVEILLLLQVALGCAIALTCRWGSTWFASTLTPYLWSLVLLQPDTAAVAAMPVLVKLHVVGASLLLLLTPFSRLAHVFTAPLQYLGRPYQQVVWNWDRRRVRDAATPWTPTPPRNN